MSLQKIRTSAIDPTLYEEGWGPTTVISAAKVGWGWKIYNTVWMFQGLLADILDFELGSLYERCIACNWLPLPVVLFYKTRNFGNIHYREVVYRE